MHVDTEHTDSGTVYKIQIPVWHSAPKFQQQGRRQREGRVSKGQGMDMHKYVSFIVQYIVLTV